MKEGAQFCAEFVEKGNLKDELKDESHSAYGTQVSEEMKEEVVPPGTGSWVMQSFQYEKSGQTDDKSQGRYEDCSTM